MSHESIIQKRERIYCHISKQACKLPSETVNRQRDLSLTVHFLYQCHMGFVMAPSRLTGSILESICSYGRNEHDHRL